MPKEVNHLIIGNSLKRQNPSKWLGLFSSYARVLASHRGGPRLDSRQIHVSLGTSSLGWRWPWSSISIVVTPTSERLDQGEHFSKGLFEQRINSYSEHLHISPRQYNSVENLYGRPHFYAPSTWLCCRHWGLLGSLSSSNVPVNRPLFDSAIFTKDDKKHQLSGSELIRKKIQKSELQFHTQASFS